jgi:hypothetical protein
MTRCLYTPNCRQGVFSETRMQRGASLYVWGGAERQQCVSTIDLPPSQGYGVPIAWKGST